MILIGVLIYLIVICITRKIIRSIIKLKLFSINMKQAHDKDSRQSIIDAIGDDPLFKSVARQYEAHVLVSKMDNNSITMMETHGTHGDGSDSDLDDDIIGNVEQRFSKIEENTILLLNGTKK